MVINIFLYNVPTDTKLVHASIATLLRTSCIHMLQYLRIKRIATYLCRGLPGRLFYLDIVWHQNETLEKYGKLGKHVKINVEGVAMRKVYALIVNTVVVNAHIALMDLIKNIYVENVVEELIKIVMKTS